MLAEISEEAIRTYGSNYIPRFRNRTISSGNRWKPELTEAEWQTIYQMFPQEKSGNSWTPNWDWLRPAACAFLLKSAKAMGLKEGGDFVAPHIGLDDSH